MLTPITKPESRSFTFLAHFFPLTTTGIPLRLAIKGGQAMLLGIDWAWSGEWMQAMRQQFDLPKLQLWIAPSLSEAAAHLSAGTYLLKLEDQQQELPVLISTEDERKVFVLAQEVDLYYEGWPERLSAVADLEIPDWQVFLRFPTQDWQQWVGQDHEVELRRKEGKYYLVNAAAGFAWCTYPFMGKFAETIGQWRLDYTIRLDILDGLAPAQKWPRLVGYIRMEPDRQLRRWTGKMKDTTKAPGADVDLYLFSDDPTVPLKARVRVAAAAEIMLVDHGDAEYEED